MERITYRITLDAYKNGIQRTLQGFETADNMARRIAINLTAGGDTIEIPSDHVTAMMYVTTPNATGPSINACEIDNNTVIYDVLPIVEEGITEMQLKLIKTDLDGARGVLAYPRFAVEVTQSNMDDGNAEQTTTFTALEDALARANAVYEKRLERIEIDKDCTFRAIYADGTVYENEYLHEALYNGNALLSESWAKGGTGVRSGEDTNNSKYYSDVSKSASEHADIVVDEMRELTEETRLNSMLTAFSVDFVKGELMYISHNYDFNLDESTGDLECHGGKSVDIEGIIAENTEEILADKFEEVDNALEDMDSHTAEVAALALKNSDQISEHTGNTSNPHSVTKEQIGLGNVDNTSDADKPISTAMQAALNNTLSFKRILNSSDDLNNIKENGIYTYITGDVPANAPFNNGAIVEVFGHTSTTTQTMQRVTRYGTCAEVKIRGLSGGSWWEEWGALPTKKDLQSVFSVSGDALTINLDLLG